MELTTIDTQALMNELSKAEIRVDACLTEEYFEGKDGGDVEVSFEKLEGIKLYNTEKNTLDIDQVYCRENDHVIDVYNKDKLVKLTTAQENLVSEYLSTLYFEIEDAVELELETQQYNAKKGYDVSDVEYISENYKLI